jgi:hypothetical protein
LPSLHPDLACHRLRSLRHLFQRLLLV